jgi:hypothetical protein
MESGEALEEIRRIAAAGWIRYSPHAHLRMYERCITAEDVRNALTNATECAAAEKERWKVSGPDLDGEDLTLVVVLEGDVVVVTVF